MVVYAHEFRQGMWFHRKLWGRELSKRPELVTVRQMDLKTGEL